MLYLLLRKVRVASPINEFVNPAHAVCEEIADEVVATWHFDGHEGLHEKLNVMGYLLPQVCLLVR